MKKIFLSILFILSMTTISQNSYDKTVDKTSKGFETVYKDGKLVVSTVYSDLKSVSPKITKGIEEIAKGLKVGANAVWDILVRQQLVWSFCFLTLTISTMFNWFLFYKRTQKTKLIGEVTYITLERDILAEIDNPKYDSYYAGRVGDIRGKLKIIGPTGGREQYSCPQYVPTNDVKPPVIQEIFKYVHLALCLILSYFSFIHFADMLTGFINPEYGAIKTITVMVQSLK